MTEEKLSLMITQVVDKQFRYAKDLCEALVRKSKKEIAEAKAHALKDLVITINLKEGTAIVASANRKVN